MYDIASKEGPRKHSSGKSGTSVGPIAKGGGATGASDIWLVKLCCFQC